MFAYVTLRNTYKHVLTYTCMNKSKKLIELPVINATNQLEDSKNYASVITDLLL